MIKKVESIQDDQIENRINQKMLTQVITKINKNKKKDN